VTKKCQYVHNSKKRITVSAFNAENEQIDIGKYSVNCVYKWYA